MQVVPATPAHAAGIAAVQVRAWQATYADILAPDFLARMSVAGRTPKWAEILRQDASRTLVALQGDAVVGFVSHGRCRDPGAAPDHGEIQALYVDPPCWGQGVGGALLAQALAEARAGGCTEVSLWVLSRNARAIGFYRQAGFVPVDGSEKRFELGGRSVAETRLRRLSGA